MSLLLLLVRRVLLQKFETKPKDEEDSTTAENLLNLEVEFQNLSKVEYMQHSYLDDVRQQSNSSAFT